ncbi:RNA-directed DNA polymerase, eukaryota, reverse transcriptase zinc-binding domain protein [Tanacetum coccineum]
MFNPPSPFDASEFVRAGDGDGGVWGDIVRLERGIDKLGIEFSSSFVRKVGDGSCISFWRDRWIKGDGWRELEDRDKWKWVLDDNGAFSVKALSDFVEVKCINTGNHNSETTWNNLILKKVNIFAWRAVHGRLPLRVELDKKGIDLHTILCPNCDEMCENIDHSLVFCNEAMKVWEKVFEWWNLQMVKVFSTKEMLRYNGDTVISANCKKLWQYVVWTTGYYIWKNRNCRVFGKKVNMTANLFHEIRLKAYEWTVRRSGKYKLNWEQWIAQPDTCMGSGGLT